MPSVHPPRRSQYHYRFWVAETASPRKGFLGTAKGGIVVALAGELGLPVRYLGVGEQVDDLVAFDPSLFVEALIPNTAAYLS